MSSAKGSVFPKTSLTLLRDLREGSLARLDEFVQRYGPPTRAYIGAILRGVPRERRAISSAAFALSTSPKPT